MKNKVIVLAAGLAIVCASAYAAPDRTGKVDIGVDVSGAFIKDNDLNDGVYVGGNLSYGLSQWLAVGMSFGGVAFTQDPVDVLGVTSSGGDLTAWPLFGDIILRVPVPQDQTVVPYGVLGLGAIFWNADDISLSNGLNFQTKVDTSFGLKLGGGIDWFVNDHWIVNFNGAYVFSDSNATVTVQNGSGGSSTGKVDLDYWTIGGGLKFVF